MKSCTTRTRNEACDNMGLPPLFPFEKNNKTLWKARMRISGSRLESTDGQEVKPCLSIEYRSANQEHEASILIDRYELDEIYFRRRERITFVVHLCTYFVARTQTEVDLSCITVRK